MNSYHSPPLLYIEEDDETQHNQRHDSLPSCSRPSTSTDMIMSHQKRKRTNDDIRVDQATVKRLRHHPQQPLVARSDAEPESIILDPDDYVIEISDAQAYRAFDWTVEDPLPYAALPAIVDVSTTNTVNAIARPLNQTDAIPRPNLVTPQQRKRHAPSRTSAPLTKPPSVLTQPSARRGRPSKNWRLAHIHSVRSIASNTRRDTRTNSRLTIQSSSAASACPSTFRSMAVTPSTENTASNSHWEASKESGILSGFHDSKYYRCNICTFKSTKRFVIFLFVRTA